MIEFEIKIEIKIDKEKYEAVKSTQGCEGCVALSDPELCGFLSITLANETLVGLSENNSGNINEIKHLHHNDICDIFGVVFVQHEQEPKPEPVVWMSCEPSTGLVYFENSGKMEHGWVPLYMAPPAPEPLSDEWIKNNIHYIHRDVSFTVLVRAVEKAHGIGADDEC